MGGWVNHKELMSLTWNRDWEREFGGFRKRSINGRCPKTME
jgi:hypothetical protein